MGDFSFLPDPEEFDRIVYGEDWGDPTGWNKYLIEEARKRQQEKLARTPIESGDWIDKATHFADALENNPDLQNPVGVPKKGFDYLTGLFTGDTRVNPQGEIDYKPLQETQPVLDFTRSLAKTMSTPIMGDTYDNPQIRDNIPVDLDNPPKSNEQEFLASGLRSGLGFATDPGVALLRHPLLGMGMTLPMLKSAPEKAGKLWSEFDRGEGLTEEGAKLAGELVPESLMLGLGLKHQVPEAAKFSAGLVPRISLGNGYSTRSPITFNNPFQAFRPQGLPNFVSPMAEGGTGGAREGSVVGDFSPETFNDPLVARLEELKNLGVLTRLRPGISRPVTESAWHGTGNKNWRLDPSEPVTPEVRPDIIDPRRRATLGLPPLEFPSVVDRPFEPFSSRHAASGNLHGGPFYFAESAPLVEGQYAVAGEGTGIDPAIINADVTRNKTWDLEGPVPRDIRVKALTKLQQAINEAKAGLPPEVASFDSGDFHRLQGLRENYLRQASLDRSLGEPLKDILDFMSPEDYAKLREYDKIIDSDSFMASKGAKLRLKNYQDIYRDLKDPNITSRDFHAKFGEALNKIASERGENNFQEYDDSAHTGSKQNPPLWDRKSKQDLDLVNKLIMDELGYDTLTHRSGSFGEKVTIPFTRHQINTRDVIPVGKLEDRSVSELWDHLQKLPDKEGANRLAERLAGELFNRSTRFWDLSKNRSFQESPEAYRGFLSNKLEQLRGKLLDSLKTRGDSYKNEIESNKLLDEVSHLEDQLQKIDEYNRLTPEDRAALKAYDDSASSYGARGEVKAPELTEEEFSLLPDALKQKAIETGQYKGQSLKNPTFRVREQKPLAEGEQYENPADWLKEESEPVQEKEINVPTVINDLARTLGYKDDPFSGSRSNVQESRSPLEIFETSQQNKYGRDWRDKQTPEETAAHNRLMAGDGVFHRVEEGIKTESEPVENRTLLRARKNPDGTVVKTFEASDDPAAPTYYREHYDKDGNLLRAEISTDPDLNEGSWQPLEDMTVEKETPKPVPTEPIPTSTEAPMSASDRKKAGLPPREVPESLKKPVEDNSQGLAGKEDRQREQAHIAELRDQLKVERQKAEAGDKEAAQRADAIESELKDVLKVEQQWQESQRKEKNSQQSEGVKEDRQREQAHIAELKKQLSVENQKAREGDREAGLRAKAIEQELRDKLRVEREWKAAQEREKNNQQSQGSAEDRQREQAHTKELREQLKVEKQKAAAGDKEAGLRAKAIEKELKDQLKVEKAWRAAQERTRWEVVLDNGTKHIVKGRDEASVRKFVEAKLANSGRTIATVTKRLTSLEKEAAGSSTPPPNSKYIQGPIAQVLNAFKSITYGGDVGHFLRQGKQLQANLLFSKGAGKLLKQFPTIFKSIKSEKFFNDFHEQLNKDADIRVLTDKFGLDMPGVGKGHLKEEAFHGGGLAEKLPVIGKYYAKPSERAYTAGLNYLRATNAKMMVDSLRKEGFTPENAPERYRAVARAINIISQRGDFSPQFAKTLADLSTVFGAPRAKFARGQNLLNLVGIGGDAESRAIMQKTFAKTMAFNVMIYGLARAVYPGAKLVTDPDRTDFGKIRLTKDLTIDPWMGIGTTARTAMKVATGKATSPYTGKSYNVTAKDAVSTEASNMLSPGIRLAYELFKGEDVAGYQKTPGESLADILPMSPRQATELIQKEGPEGVILAALQMAGEDVQRFNYQESQARQRKLKLSRGLTSGGNSTNVNSKYGF